LDFSTTNTKGRAAGLQLDAFKEIELLPDDNKERFLSKYWELQKERNEQMEAKTLRVSKIQRCLCDFCGNSIRNPYFRTSHAVAAFRLQRATANTESALEPGEPEPVAESRHPPTAADTKVATTHNGLIEITPKLDWISDQQRQKQQQPQPQPQQQHFQQQQQQQVSTSKSSNCFCLHLLQKCACMSDS
jgi:hypothetical protein